MRKSLVIARHMFSLEGESARRTIAAYERDYADAIGAPHAVAFLKGRLAFYAALKALGLGAGDEIIMPGYTCMVVPAAAMHLGIVPIYVDIEPTWCTLDPDRYEAAVTPRTRGILIQHTYGYPNAGLDRIVEFASRRGLHIFEDCCHALGTRHRGQHVGTFGTAAFFSSQWSKPFTTGLGGMMICRDRDLYERVLKLRDNDARPLSRGTTLQLAVQGIIYDMIVYPGTMAMARNAYRWLSRNKMVTGSTCPTEYSAWKEDQFQQMSAAQAAAGRFELNRLDRAIEHRRGLTRYYEQLLGDAGWPIPPWPADADVTLLRLPVRVPNKAELLAAADGQRVELGDWFIRPLHSHLAPQEGFGYRDGMCPQAERASREIVNLPLHLRVSRAHARRAVELLKKMSKPVHIPS